MLSRRKSPARCVSIGWHLSGAPRPAAAPTLSTAARLPLAPVPRASSKLSLAFCPNLHGPPDPFLAPRVSPPRNPPAAVDCRLMLPCACRHRQPVAGAVVAPGAWAPAARRGPTLPDFPSSGSCFNMACLLRALYVVFCGLLWFASDVSPMLAVETTATYYHPSLQGGVMAN